MKAFNKTNKVIRIRNNQELFLKLKKEACKYQLSNLLSLEQLQTQQEQQKYLCFLLRQWFLIDQIPYFDNEIDVIPKIDVQEFDFDMKCQLTGRIPSNFSRTTLCDFVCVVDKKILQSNKICCCGKIIDNIQCKISEDWILSNVLSYLQKYKSELIKNWNGVVRINFKLGILKVLKEETSYETQKQRKNN